MRPSAVNSGHHIDNQRIHICNNNLLIDNDFQQRQQNSKLTKLNVIIQIILIK